MGDNIVVGAQSRAGPDRDGLLAHAGMGCALDDPGMEQLDGALVEAAHARHVEQETLEPRGVEFGRGDLRRRVHAACPAAWGPPLTAVTFTSQMMPGIEKFETWKPVQVG